LESVVNHWVPTVRRVEDAESKSEVEEAARENGEPVRRRSVEVALVVCPRYAVWRIAYSIWITSYTALYT
jgi:hypothetical protein